MSDFNIIKTAYHRNGIVGKPFNVTIFESDEHKRRFLAVTFDKNGHYAVLDLDLAAQGVIEFAINSWPGEKFVDDLPNPTDPD